MRIIQIGSASCGLFFLLILLTGWTCAKQCPSADDITCDNGECIPRKSWCNKKNDCSDTSDESYCKKSGWFKPDPNKCEEMGKHFLCEDGPCFPMMARCDGFEDCEDGSDEEDCEYVFENYDLEKTSETSPPVVHTTEVSSLIYPSSSKADLNETPTNLENDDVEKTSSKVTAITTTPTPLPSQPSTSLISPPSTQWPEVIRTDFYHKKMMNAVTDTSNNQPQDPSHKRYTAPVLAAKAEDHMQIESSTKQYTVSSQSRQTHPSLQRQTHPPQQRQTHPPQQRQTHPPQQRQTHPPQQRQTHPPQQRQTHPPQQRQTHPSLQRYTYLPQQRQTHPPQQRYTHPPQQRQTHPPQQRQTHPPQQRYTQPPQQQYTHPPQQPYTYSPQQHTYPPQQRHTYPPQQRFTNAYPQQSPNNNNYVSQPQQNSYSSQFQQPRYPHNVPDQQRPSENQRADNRYPTESKLDINSYRHNGNVHSSRRSDRPDSNTSILTPRAYTGHYKAPSTFYFEKNYTTLHSNGHSISKAYQWLRRIRDAKAGWGKDTPRALIALSLVNNSFVAGTHEVDLLKKYFQVYLGVKLLKPETINKNRLAIFMNALLATCQDPRDFHGIDLTELMRKEHQERNTHFLNPFIYLSLCLADVQLSVHELHVLQRRLHNHVPQYDQEKDMLSFAIMAYACHLQHLASSSTDHAYRRQLEEVLSNATSKLLELRQNDGSFGSIYSTALAAQALLSVNDSRNWDAEVTFDFLKNQQTSNGSFGDLLATYYVLPVLSGRSLLHLRNTQCNPLTLDRELTPLEILEYIGPKQYIRYSLHFQLPLVNSYSVDVHVPVGINFFDVMRVAEYQNKHFKSLYEVKDENISVYSISDLPNDSEKGFAWHLYIKKDFGVNGSHINNQELYTGDIRKLFPTADRHFIFWYHPNGYRA